MSKDRKRSRKSKLEVRECDYEVVNEKEEVTTPISQIFKSALRCNTTTSENLTRYEHDYCLPGYQRIATYYSPSMFRVPRSVYPTSITAKQDFPETTLNLNNQLHSILKERNKPAKSSTPDIMETGAQNIKMCKYNPDMLFETSQQITSESMNLADRILDIELRNMWGNILHTPHETDPHETILQKTIEVWQVWVHGWKNIRKSPLFYQCHMCDLAWWRLHDFRQHIKRHDSDKLRVTLKELVHECLFVASYEPVTKLIFINIEGDCWKCGRDLDFHRDNSCVYQCDRCQKSLYTCEMRRMHESECVYPSQLAKFNICQDRKCSVCGCVLDSMVHVESHMIETHSVRTDEPSPNCFKTCSNCKGRYFTFSEHNCSKSAKNAGCNYCCRKFATKQLAISHMVSPYNRTAECRVCFKTLEKKCLEMEHIFKQHSDNYQLAYKCTLCANQYLLFIDELSMKKHRQLWHHRKHDKRRNYYESMLVPKRCLQEGSIEEAFQRDHDYDTQNHSLIALGSDDDDGSETESDQQSHPNNERTDDDDDFCVPDIPPRPLIKSIVTPEVDVTVDEVDIKKEPVEYDENGEIDYEEMLRNMFNIKSDEPKTPQPSVSKISPTVSESPTAVVKKNVTTDYLDHNIPSKSTDFDIANVRIKEEPIDDIDIIENTVETIHIKAEPVDEPTDAMDTDQSKSLDSNELKEHFIFRIKDEPMDDEHPSVETFLVKKPDPKPKKTKKVTKAIVPINSAIKSWDIKVEDASSDNVILKKPKSGYGVKPTKKKSIESPTTNEVSFKVINPRGTCKEKTVYVCKLCGYTAPYKQYKIHKDSLCALSSAKQSSHPCSKCGLNFEMFRDYVLHFARHGYECMACPVCNEVFEFQPRLISHVQKHMKAEYVGIRLLKQGGVESSRAHKKVKCRKCNKVIPQDDMFLHWEAHLNLKTLSGGNETESEEVRVKIEPPEAELNLDCERIAKNSKSLDHATLRAAVDQLTATAADIAKTCVVCGRLFVRRSDAKRHVVEHLLMDAHIHKQTTNNLFRCQICFGGFVTQENYKFHMRDHGAMPIFKCELCNKNFSDSSNFAKHKKTHNVRVLICDICQKKFHSKFFLEKHIAVRACQTEHETQVKIKCAFCSKMCFSKSHYRKHKYQAHMRTKFKCRLCEVAFDSLQKKWDHDWQVHKQRKQNADCPICMKSFRKFQEVRRHARLDHQAEVRVVKMQRSAMLYKVKNLKEETEMLVINE